MDSTLIVSHSEKNLDAIYGMLQEASISQMMTVHSCGDARRLLLERDFDLVIINAPLPDETGESLARHIAGSGDCQVILAVKNEYFQDTAAVCESDGVLTIAKPISKALFWAALRLAAAVQVKIRRLMLENRQLVQRIEDMRCIDRAKYVLITCCCLSEQEAHRKIEKMAMNLRTSKRKVAEEIIRAYAD